MKHTFKWPEVAAFRLNRHHLTGPNSANLIEIGQNICGVQAQVMSAAEMQLWARRHDLTRAEIHAALWEKRRLVKTYGMRGTLHLLPTADFSIYINALKKSQVESARRNMSRVGIAEKDVDALNEAAMAALSNGPLSKGELTARVKPQVGKKLRAVMTQFWNIFRSAFAEGLICYGPESGKEAIFIRVDQWLPKQKEISEAEAQQILWRRFLRAYGPATLQDFSHWTGLLMKEAKTIWEARPEELLEVSVEGEKAFLLREDYDLLANNSPEGQVLRLLPLFDPYLLAHADKKHLVSPAQYKRVYRNQGWISPVILLDGKIIGVWSYARRAKRWALEVEPFKKFSKAVRARIEEEAVSLGNFLETEWEIKFGKYGEFIEAQHSI
jgi:hypothetical protein